MNKPEISVIMSAYNHEKFVAKAIQSVLLQSFENFEFLIADDGSTDNTAKIIQQFTDSRIRLFLQKTNIGACACLNILLNNCKGNYIAIINSDDEFCKDKLKIQHSFLQSSGFDGCFTWAQIIDENGDEIANSPLYELFDTKAQSCAKYLKTLFFKGNCFCHPTFMLKRRCYTLRFDIRLLKLPDMDMWVRLLKKYNITVLNSRLTRFRVLDNCQNMSANTPQTQALMAIELPIIMAHYLTLSREMCALVFNKTGNFIERRFCAYQAALICSAPIRAWGYQGMYKLFGANRAKIFGLSLKSLQDKCANDDVFNQLPNVAKLYYTQSALQSFDETRCISLPYVNSGKITLEFAVDLRLHSLRLDICQVPAKIELKELWVTDVEKSVNIISNITHNGKTDEQYIVFNHFDPGIIYIFAAITEVKSVKTAVNLTFLDINELLPPPMV